MFRPVRGMKDLYDIDMKKYDLIVNIALNIAKKYGYTQISTPILEYTDVFQRSIGDETDVVSKEMYSFIDKGGESVTLRPEGTAGVMRSIVSESLHQNLPVKVMYHGPMFRYDRPQKGRYRQFHQLGFEHVGGKSPYTDAITIAMASEILCSIGIFDFKILLNTLGDEETRSEYVKGLVKYLSRHKEDLSEESQIRLEKNPMRILDSKDKTDKEICSMAPIITDYLSKESERYFEKVCRLLDEYGVNYEIDNFLVRGLDYYSHTAFEFKSTSHEYKDALGGGGRYDKLLEMFGGPATSGVGFAFGVERLMLMLNNNKLCENSKKVAVIPVSDEEQDIAFKIFRQLHTCDIHAEFIHLGNISKKMKIANRLNCDYAVIIGEEEVENGTVTVKFMNSDNIDHKTRTVPQNNLIQFLRAM